MLDLMLLVLTSRVSNTAMLICPGKFYREICTWIKPALKNGSHGDYTVLTKKSF